jgi:oligopeptide/dipeptide ABC transporter ATP-binding protein
MTEPLLRVERLIVSFPVEGRTRQPVAGISYELAAGRTLGVVGESGSGKSLTALSVLGLVPAPGRVTGSIRFAGTELVGASPGLWHKLRGDRIAMVFQEPMTALNPVMTIGRQIAEVLVLHQELGWRAARDAAVGLLDSVGIPSAKARAGAYPHQLSGGMRQRAMIAMALACRPALLIADEPTTALDVTVQGQILALLRGLPLTQILVTHDFGVLAGFCNRALVMYAGRVVESAPAAELFEAPRHPYTQGLIATLPDPDRRVDRLPVIAGGVPNIDADIIGCRFAARCPLADVGCRAAEPPLDPVAPGHLAACFKARA